jgi:hypothetical protein
LGIDGNALTEVGPSPIVDVSCTPTYDRAVGAKRHTVQGSCRNLQRREAGRREGLAILIASPTHDLAVHRQSDDVLGTGFDVSESAGRRRRSALPTLVVTPTRDRSIDRDTRTESSASRHVSRDRQGLRRNGLARSAPAPTADDAVRATRQRVIAPCPNLDNSAQVRRHITLAVSVRAPTSHDSIGLPRKRVVVASCNLNHGMKIRWNRNLPLTIAAPRNDRTVLTNGERVQHTTAYGCRIRQHARVLSLSPVVPPPVVDDDDSRVADASDNGRNRHPDNAERRAEPSSHQKRRRCHAGQGASRSIRCQAGQPEFGLGRWPQNHHHLKKDPPARGRGGRVPVEMCLLRSTVHQKHGPVLRRMRATSPKSTSPVPSRSVEQPGHGP